MGVFSGPADWWTDGTNEGRTHIATKGVVQDGLVLNLDAGASTSYPGSGTTWTDLSGNSNTGTITNGPTYSSADGGFFTFDGTNEYVTVDDAIRTDVGEFVATPSNPFSISAWFKPDITDITRNAIFAKAGGYGSSGNIFLQYRGTNLASVIRGDTTNNFYSTLTSTWHEIAICWDGTTFKAYVNGSFVSNLNVGTANSQDRMFSIGNAGSGTGNEPFKGDISIVKVYNKALTAVEVEQNYDVTKGRYGL